MKVSVLLASLAVVPAMVAAHPNQVPGGPRLWGSKRAVRAVGNKDNFKIRHQSAEAIDKRSTEETANLEKRQDGDTRCGAGYGSCSGDLSCCSPSGYCGNSAEHCAAPGCQFNYGPGCDTLQVPAGPKTSGVPRDHKGSVPYGGEGIYGCTVPGTFALTFDDGPYIYTGDVLDILDKYNVKATFFVTGNSISKGAIDRADEPWGDMLRRMHAAGHQIASHTWGHQSLGSGAAVQGQDELTPQQRLDQMYNNEIALNNVLGFFPTYMRPPYSDCDAESGCQNAMSDLGYHIVYFDFDTEGYLNSEPNRIELSEAIFDSQVDTRSPASGSWLNIEHDIHEPVAHQLTEYIVRGALERGWKLVTVGECLGDPQENWYRTV